MKTIKVCGFRTKGEKCYIASYETLDLVTQGETKQEALLNLLDVITMQIDYAIKEGNIKNILPPFPVSKRKRMK
jgi:predicted RNase H-like HicB family nuclease